MVGFGVSSFAETMGLAIDVFAPAGGFNARQMGSAVRRFCGRPRGHPGFCASAAFGATSLVFCCSAPGALSCSPREPAKIPEKDRGLAPAIFSPAGLNFEQSLSSIGRDHLFSALEVN